MPIHVLLAGLPQALQHTLERNLAQHVDLAVTSVGNHLEVLLAVGEREADVVVLGIHDRDLPGVATHLLDEYPHLRILAVRTCGQHAEVYELLPRLVPIGEVLLDGLPDVISAAIQSRSP
jgi:DNA-binding NarL/FixJ family response regulator